MKSMMMEFSRSMLSFSLLALLMVGMGDLGFAQDSAVVYPHRPYFGCIYAGASEAREVIQLYGEGLFIDSLGGMGSRYYTDPKKAVTMIVEFETDWIVELVRIRKGYHPPVGADLKAEKKMVSKFLDRSVRLCNFCELNFGQSPDDIRRKEGTPTSTYEDDGEIVWVYENIHPGDMSDGISYRFKADKVVCVDFWAEGC